MKKLDTAHHKLIMIALIVVVLVVGVYFGSTILGTSNLEGMIVLLFALLFVNSVLLYMVFAQLVHLQHGRNKK